MTSIRCSEALSRWPDQVWKWFHTLKWTTLSQSEADCSWRCLSEFCLCDQVRKNVIDRTWPFGTLSSSDDLIVPFKGCTPSSTSLHIFPLLPSSSLQTLFQMFFSTSGSHLRKIYFCLLLGLIRLIETFCIAHPQRHKKTCGFTDIIIKHDWSKHVISMNMVSSIKMFVTNK